MGKMIERLKRFLFKDATPRRRDDQQHVMSAEEKLDETIDESFPASDPPGHFSKSAEDAADMR